MKEQETGFFEDWQALIEDFEKFSKSADNPYFKSKYVPLKQILPTVKEKCKKHNFIWMQYPGIIDGKCVLNTRILHVSGLDVVGTVELIHKPEDPQKLGASITYMRRYSLTCMLGLEEDDDDGNTASGKQEVKQRTFEENVELAQQNDLMCADCGTDIEYHETKAGEARLKCSKDWKHKTFISKSENSKKAKEIANSPF